MSYDSKTMRRLDGPPGEATFRYSTEDSPAAVKGAGYFDAAVGEYNLSSGDIIMAVTATGGTPVPAVLGVRVSGGIVTVASA